MMYKKITAYLGFLICIAICLPLKVVANEEELAKAEILIVYNNNPTEEEMIGVQSIVKILTYMQHTVVFTSVDESLPVLDNYDSILCYGLKGNLENFVSVLAKADKAVFIMGSGGVIAYVSQKGYDLTYNEIPKSIASVSYEFSEDNKFTSLLNLEESVLLEGQFTYQNGKITVVNQTASLYSRYDDFLYMPSTELSNSLIKASFTQEVAKWLWPYSGEPFSYAQYIVMNEVYPFTPPEKLLEAVNYLIDLKLPFVISVMPIYENGKYPAMKRFCEVLRYAQANGGTIIMHTPIITQDSDNMNQIWEYLTIATETYVNYGIYPLGIEVPESFMFSETNREIIKRYSTVFWYEEKEEVAIDLTEQYNTISNDGHNMIGTAINLDKLGNSQIKVHSTAFYLNINDGIDAIKAGIDACKQSGIPMKSLWDVDQQVYANNVHLYTEHGQVYYNDSKVSLDYTPFEYDKKYKYNDVFRLIMVDLKGLNEKLVFIVALTTIIFVIFIIKARNVNKAKFLYPKERRQKK